MDDTADMFGMQEELLEAMEDGWDMGVAWSRVWRVCGLASRAVRGATGVFIGNRVAEAPGGEGKRGRRGRKLGLKRGGRGWRGGRVDH